MDFVTEKEKQKKIAKSIHSSSSLENRFLAKVES